MKDKDWFLREPSMVVKISPVQTELTSEDVQTKLTSEKELTSKPCEPIFEDFFEKPSKPINHTLTKPLQVYSKRIKPVINLVQVQKTKSSLGTEVVLLWRYHLLLYHLLFLIWIYP